LNSYGLSKFVGGDSLTATRKHALRVVIGVEAWTSSQYNQMAKEVM